MSRGQSIWLLSLLLVLLLLFCASRHAPTIERDLSERSRMVLAADKLTWTAVTVNGRDLTLTGTAPSAELSKRAAELAAAVWGVRRVENRLEVAAAADDTAAPPR